ncbi:hypothetical protein FCV25MIE_21630 [Fagus crenata]
MMAIYPVIFVLMEANLCCNKMHSCTDMPTYLKVFTLSDDHPFLHFLCANASDEHGVPHWKWCKVIVRRVLQ